MRRFLWIILAVTWVCGCELDAQTMHATVMRDVVYARVAGREMLMDIYLPPGATKDRPVPVVLYFHGGEWRYGTRRDAAGRFLTEYGLAVASVEYRLAPKYRFPAQIKDARDALVFVSTWGKRYGLDTEKIGAMGESAGGHLAALLATSLDDETFNGANGAKGKLKLTATCSIAGPMDLAALGYMGDLAESVVGTNPITILLGGRASEKMPMAMAASPIAHVSGGVGPMLLVVGENDVLVPAVQGKLMDETLRKAGAASEVYEVKGIGHQMERMYEGRTLEVVGGFFQKRLLGYPTTRPARAR